MSRPLHSRKRFSALSRSLATVLGVLLAGSAAAEEIDFDDVDPANTNCCYLTDEYADLGVEFVPTDDGSVWGGMSNGDPGRWRLEGSQGPAFLGFNGASYALTAEFDAPVVGFSLDAARAFGSSSGMELSLVGMREGEDVETVSVPFGSVNEWVTATLTSEVDAVRWEVAGSAFRPYGVDHLRWEPTVAAEPDPLEIEIDLVAHGESHRVPLQRRGMLPVILYGNEAVSVQDLDLASPVLGDAATPRLGDPGPNWMDANDDGLMDVLLFFSTQATGLEEGDEWVCLDGQTTGGEAVTGCMAVEVVAPPGGAVAEQAQARTKGPAR